MPAAPVPPTVVDRNGQVLTTQAHPSLATILPQIIAVAPAGPPKPATAVKVVDDATGAETPLEVVAKESGNTVASTFDARIQSAAQQAISGAPGPAALVVVQPGTGHILALSNNPPGQKVATHSGAAPGSAFKAVVASALVSAGDTPTTPVPCPETYTIPNGRSFKNDHPGDTNLEATLEQDFAVSCNTAFVQRGIDKLPPSALIQHAGGAFGLAGPWDIGLGDPRTYWSVPDPGANRDLYGEDLIGQGKITMEPLALASVAATAGTGTFRQPILIPGTRQVPAGRPANADALRRMMRRTVTNGTASSLARLAGDVGAKTGTADITGGNANWMIAYRGSDLAVACLVITTDDHRGNDTAGPLVATLFQSI